MAKLKREKVEIEYNGAKYEFFVRELTVREYQDVLRAGLGSQGKIRAIANEPMVIDFDLVSYSYELVRRAVEDFGEFGSVENLPITVYEKLVEKAMELNPFPAIFAG